MQLKVNGYRIELGEIETALQAVNGAGDVCCVFAPEEGKIVCAWSGPAEEKELKGRLRVQLPKYMLPDVWLHLDALPKTGSGKIDRVSVKQGYEHSVP